MNALRYHESTKHHFNRFARSLGYLDWASQPDPFRRYAGAPLFDLPRESLGTGVPYAALFDGTARPQPLTDASMAEFLRCAMGLSAWKQYERSRWALRVNPSSGNLHPTEAYVVRTGRVWHYAPREHALEQRAEFDAAAWRTFSAGADGFLVGLTSIHWREAWKYGERAFRYCQHDTGHALAALRLAAAMLGWRLTLLSRWSDAQVAALLGVDREADFGEAEREEPECIGVVTAGDVEPWAAADAESLVAAARSGRWAGSANRLSRDHVEWPIIDAVARATRKGSGMRDQGSGIRDEGSGIRDQGSGKHGSQFRQRSRSLTPDPSSLIPDPGSLIPDARTLILQRRSAVAFDGRSTLPKATFLAMLARLQPGAAPWDAIDWDPQVHLLLFIHRVDGLSPGVYAYLRDDATAAAWQSAMRPDFLWEETADRLFLLVPTDVTWPANRVSCDQDIAGDGFFSLGMLAPLESSLRERGEWFYRRLFWESGMIGQVLYLEAEAAGARSTGIGCFYDDAVHELAGLSGVGWQSLYHFSMGMPVDDERLTTEPGYAWELT